MFHHTNFNLKYVTKIPRNCEVMKIRFTTKIISPSFELQVQHYETKFTSMLKLSPTIHIYEWLEKEVNFNK